MEVIIVLALVVLLVVFVVAAWSQRNKEGSLWVKVFGVQAKVEQREPPAGPKSTPVTQEQVNVREGKQSVEVTEGSEIRQRQEGVKKSSQKVVIRK